MTEFSPRELLDAIKRSLRATGRRFARPKRRAKPTAVKAAGAATKLRVKRGKARTRKAAVRRSQAQK